MYLLKYMIFNSHVQTVINDRINSFSMKYLVIMKLRMLINKCVMIAWDNMVSMKISVKLVRNQWVQ